MESINLFSPIRMRGLELKNRMVVSPMQMYSATDGIPNDWHLVHLGSRAVGGAALIITEATAVSPDGMNTRSDTGIWNEGQVEAWRNIVRFVQAQGAKIAVQLWHSGAKGSHSHPSEGLKYLSPENGGWIPKSASPMKLDDTYHSQALNVEEITAIRVGFVDAARRAVEAGFDCIELHAGHGYLFHQFYSPLVNHRDDDYGGSFERRIGLLVETVQLIRQEIPEDMPLFVRISAVDYIDEDNAWKIEDSIKLAGILKESGVDVVTASAGGFVFLDKSRVFPSYQVPFAEAIKSQTGIITGAVGAITTPEQANGIIASGQADLAVMAREFLRDPYFPIRAAKSLGHDISVPFQYKRAY